MMKKALLVAASWAATLALGGCMGRGLMGGGFSDRDYPMVTSSPNPTSTDYAQYERAKAECIRVVEATSPGPVEAGIGGAILGASFAVFTAFLW